jgi:hypothetical protein
MGDPGIRGDIPNGGLTLDDQQSAIDRPHFRNRQREVGLLKKGC